VVLFRSKTPRAFFRKIHWFQHRFSTVKVLRVFWGGNPHSQAHSGLILSAVAMCTAAFGPWLAASWVPKLDSLSPATEHESCRGSRTPAMIND
jgi:hypothetical protein